jgi:hypothetical protein
MLLMRQQVPAGISQKQKHGLYLHLAEVFATPGLYRQIRERLHVFPTIHRERRPMPSVTDNITLEDVVRHLASIGVSDTEVREAYHYGIGWVTSNSESRREEEAAASSDVLQRLRLLPSPSPEDSPLKTEPQWWFAPAGARCFTQPPKRRREEDRPGPSTLIGESRGTTASMQVDDRELSASMHSVPPAVSVPAVAPRAIVASIPPLPVVPEEAPAAVNSPQGLQTLSIHPALPEAKLDTQSYPAKTDLPQSIASAPQLPDHPERRGPATPDHADGGWTYVGPSRRTQADKNRAKKDRRRERDKARATQVPPAGSSGTRWDYSKTRPTRSRKKAGSESEHTDSVSEDTGEGAKAPQLGLGTSTTVPATVETPSAFTNQPPAPSPITPSISLDFEMDLDDIPGSMHSSTIDENTHPSV